MLRNTIGYAVDSKEMVLTYAAHASPSHAWINRHALEGGGGGFFKYICWASPLWLACHGLPCCLSLLLVDSLWLALWRASPFASPFSVRLAVWLAFWLACPVSAPFSFWMRGARLVACLIARLPWPALLPHICPLPTWQPTGTDAPNVASRPVNVEPASPANLLCTRTTHQTA